MADRAFYEILAAADEYLIGVRTLRNFEEWLAARLQSIAKSGDAEAIRIADELEADLVDFSEGDIEERDLRQRWTGHLNRERTVMIGDDRSLPAPTALGTGSSTVLQRYDIDVPTTLHLKHEFVG